MRKIWLPAALLGPLLSAQAHAQELADAIRLGDARAMAAHLGEANKALAYGETPLMLAALKRQEGKAGRTRCFLVIHGQS